MPTREPSPAPTFFPSSLPTAPPTCPSSCGLADKGAGTCEFRDERIQCTACNPGTLLFDGHCVDSIICQADRVLFGPAEDQSCRCPDDPDRNCHTCTLAHEASSCRSCRNGFYVHDGSCHEQCPGNLAPVPRQSLFGRRCLSVEPTASPTREPSASPTPVPTANPTDVPTDNPTAPTATPTAKPTPMPTTLVPTSAPTAAPTTFASVVARISVAAVQLGCGSVVTGTTHGGSQLFGSPTLEQYYSLTISSATTLHIHTCSPHFTFDTVISVYDVDALTSVSTRPLHENDDPDFDATCAFHGYPSMSAPVRQSFIGATLSPGSYLIVIEGFDDSGDFALSIVCPAAIANPKQP